MAKENKIGWHCGTKNSIVSGSVAVCTVLAAIGTGAGAAIGLTGTSFSTFYSILAGSAGALVGGVLGYFVSGTIVDNWCTKKIEEKAKKSVSIDEYVIKKIVADCSKQKDKKTSIDEAAVKKVLERYFSIAESKKVVAKDVPKAPALNVDYSTYVSHGDKIFNHSSLEYIMGQVGDISKAVDIAAKINDDVFLAGDHELLNAAIISFGSEA